MFLWDIFMGDVMDSMLDWVYAQLIGFLANFFNLMDNMGANLFDVVWVQGIVLFFSYLAWALFVIGIVVAVFEYAIEQDSGRSSIKDLSMNVIKGFMATSLITVVPIRLYELSVSLSATLTTGLTGMNGNIYDVTSEMLSALSDAPTIDDALNSFNFGVIDISNPIMLLFIIIMIGYAVIKVFFANLKRGGILLVQICVSSLYMFSVPRGYSDLFIQWCKQVIALCLTAFLQMTILTVGLLILKQDAIMGLGLMLSAGEVPRIAEAFGLDTSTKASLIGAVQMTSTAVNVTRNVMSAIPK